jgi:hypothetical protein
VTHRNRVDPYGRLRADPERGLFFGNRGVLHDRGGRIRRERSPEIRWITCVTEWKGRRRPLLRPGHYTELFFCDEAVALAAGHRPCAECRRPAYRAFLEAVGDATIGGAVALDRRLDGERGRPRRLDGDPTQLPDGTFVDAGDDGPPLLVAGGRLRPWTPGGYLGPVAVPSRSELRLLTPATTLSALRGGYRPTLHPSAGVSEARASPPMTGASR